MYEINIQATLRDYSFDFDDFEYTQKHIRLIAASEEIAEAVTYNVKRMTEQEALQFLNKYDDTIILSNELSLEVSYKPLEIDFE